METIPEAKTSPPNHLLYLRTDDKFGWQRSRKRAKPIILASHFNDIISLVPSHLRHGDQPSELLYRRKAPQRSSKRAKVHHHYLLGVLKIYRTKPPVFAGAGLLVQFSSSIPGPLPSCVIVTL